MTDHEMLTSLMQETDITMPTARTVLEDIAGIPEVDVARAAINRVMMAALQPRTDPPRDGMRALIVEIRNALVPARHDLLKIGARPAVRVSIIAIDRLLNFTTECENDIRNRRSM